MNDFTKEELQELLLGYEMHEHNSRFNWPSLELIKKLRMLIDNYCEHNWYYTQKDLQQCAKCGRHK